MGNPGRGEVELALGGKTHVLCLTLGALAEIETVCSDGRALDARRLLAVLEILLRAGGSAVSAQELTEARLDPDEAARAVAACFEAAL